MSRFRTLLTYEEDTFIARCRRSPQPLAEGVALRVLPVGKAVGHAPADNRRHSGSVPRGFPEVVFTPETV